MNVKYFEVPDSTGNPQVQLNPNANGNGWFVKSYKIVANANEEIKSLDKFDSKETAFIELNCTQLKKKGKLKQFTYQQRPSHQLEMSDKT